MNTRIVRSVMAAGLLALVSACSSTPDEPAVDDSSMAQDSDSGLSGSGVDSRELARAREMEARAQQDAALRRQLTVYFDFDSSQIRDEYTAMLDAHARYLRDNPNVRVRLEGHTDERGTREYNIALGERRAESVRRALLLRGATRGQLSVVSYGEERPAVLGSGEEAWSRNRRVGLVYQ